MTLLRIDDDRALNMDQFMALKVRKGSGSGHYQLLAVARIAEPQFNDHPGMAANNDQILFEGTQAACRQRLASLIGEEEGV